LNGTLLIHSYASSAGTVGTALGLALVNDATSSETLAHASTVLLPDDEVVLAVTLSLHVSVVEAALVTGADG
jgi:hypothetical protein